MAGRTPRQAADNFIKPIQRALSCITTEAIVASGYDPEDKHALVLNGGKAVTVATVDGDHVFGVSVLQNYRLVEVGPDDERGPWKVSTTKYVYTLHDEVGELFAYHWHPGIGPRYPHMHVKATTSRTLAKAHFATGRVSLEDFVRVLIQDFKVRPRRANWRNMLQDTQAAFERWRTWP